MAQAVDTYNQTAFRRSSDRQEFLDAPRAGEEAPDFTAQTADGGRVRLSEFRGKAHVILEFGAIT